LTAAAALYSEIIMNEFEFTSVIDEKYYDALESLVYFNKQQRLYYRNILDGIEKYGEPKIIRNNNQLKLEVGNNTSTQCIFANHEGKPVGMLLYTRNHPHNIHIVHIALDNDFTLKGQFSKSMLVSRMLKQVQEIAKRIKGINTITIEYTSNSHRVYSIPLKK